MPFIDVEARFVVKKQKVNLYHKKSVNQFTLFL